MLIILIILSYQLTLSLCSYLSASSYRAKYILTNAKLRLKSLIISFLTREGSLKTKYVVRMGRFIKN